MPAVDRAAIAERNARIRKLRGAGVFLRQIAVEVGVCRSTIEMVLRAERQPPVHRHAAELGGRVADRAQVRRRITPHKAIQHADFARRFVDEPIPAVERRHIVAVVERDDVHGVVLPTVCGRRASCAPQRLWRVPRRT